MTDVPPSWIEEVDLPTTEETVGALAERVRQQEEALLDALERIDTLTRNMRSLEGRVDRMIIGGA